MRSLRHSHASIEPLFIHIFLKGIYTGIPVRQTEPNRKLSIVFVPAIPVSFIFNFPLFGRQVFFL